MNLEQKMEQLRDLKNELNRACENAARVSASATATEQEMDDAAKAVNLARKRVNLMQAEVDNLQQQQQTPGAAQPVEDKQPENKQLKKLLASNEYARAFTEAICCGAKPGSSLNYRDSLKPVYDALTMSGGTPKGSDGGFLVPEDIDNMVREQMRDWDDLAELFNVEEVSTNTGWRVADNAPTKGFTKLSGELAAVAKDDQPQFRQVDFSLDTYGLIIPISNELVQDEMGNLFKYLAGWFAKKLVLTNNAILLNMLKTLTATALTGGLVKGVKGILNKSLPTAISRGAVILTNQNGFDAMDQEEDGNKRPLLQPDVADATQYRFSGRRVKVLDNEMLPDAEGASPLYVGNFKQFGTLFRRMPLELRGTDIGGQAWSNNGYEMRGIVRLGASKFDEKAAVARTVSAGA